MVVTSYASTFCNDATKLYYELPALRDTLSKKGAYAMANIKPINLVQVTGRVRFKRYNEEDGSLFFVVSVVIPRPVQGAENDNLNRDFPAFTISGDEAKELDEKMKVGDSVSVVGHMDTRMIMRSVDRNLFKRSWQAYLIADHVVINERRLPNSNSVTVAGEVIRVYRNADEGKRFYMVTLRIPLDNGSVTRATFTLFDRRMQAEPKVGDFAMANGVIQTHRMESDGRRQSTIITSIVARNMTLERGSENAVPAAAENHGETADAQAEAVETDIEEDTLI